MNICDSDIRCCILIRGTRSSTTKEMINIYCQKYGHINYTRCAVTSQGIMRGYNVVYAQEQAVNRFMDDRPHRIDGQSVKVKRCISSDEEWRLTKEIRVTTTDSSTDEQVFHEPVLRDYFSKYGAIRECRIDSYHNHPCAYLMFTDFDRVDQLINDKPHTINNFSINVRKHITTDNKATNSSSKQTSTNNKKRREHSSVEPEHHRIKQHRSSTTTSEDNQMIRFQNEYERFNTQMKSLHPEQSFDNNTNKILHKLQNDVENLLKQIKTMHQQNKTFADELFEKYTIEYILSINENDVNQRLEQLEKENQLLLLIKQNMPNKTIPKFEPL